MERKKIRAVLRSSMERTLRQKAAPLLLEGLYRERGSKHREGIGSLSSHVDVMDVTMAGPETSPRPHQASKHC